MARQRKSHACRYCGKVGCWWHKAQSVNGKPSWLLYEPDDVTLHRCVNAPQPIPNGQPVTQNSQVDPEPQIVRVASTTNDASAVLFGLIAEHVRTELDARFGDLDLSKLAPQTEPAQIVVTLADGEPLAVIDGAHYQAADLIRMIGAGVHALLVGPAGSGKTHACDQVAQALGLAFYPMSVGPQTSKTDLFGYRNALDGSLVRTPFRDAYELGGLFLLDEIDAGNAAVLTALNAALANGHCSFPDAVVKQHADFRCVAAGNTWGHGQNRVYVGRNQLDAATLDRFVNVSWTYDETLEKQIGASRPDWTAYIHSLRAAADANGIRKVLSTRAIVKGCKLYAAGFDRATVEDLVLWNGCSADDRAKLTAAALAAAA